MVCKSQIGLDTFLHKQSFGTIHESGFLFGQFQCGTHWSHFGPDHPVLQIHCPGLEYRFEITIHFNSM